MSTLPAELRANLMPFAGLFSGRVFTHIQVLLAGAILAPGQRTVCSCLRAMGLESAPNFQKYHRFPNRVCWSPRKGALILLRLLVQHFVPNGPLVLGLDDTLERRRGAHIQAKGIYRDPVRSSHSHFVKASGLRWLCLMLLVPIPFAKRVWALPFFTVLAPSERAPKQKTPQREKTKKLTDLARQMVTQVRRWLPERTLVLTVDSSFAALELLAAWTKKPSNPNLTPLSEVTVVTRLRLDAALYEAAPPRLPGQKGAPRKKGARLPTLDHVLHDPQTVWQELFVNPAGNPSRNPSRNPSGSGAFSGFLEEEVWDVCSGVGVWYHTGMPVVPLRWVLVRDPSGKRVPQGFLCTDQSVAALQILQWYGRRWSVEVTFREVREHLGVETQRQWNDLAIARTTPLLLALFSLVTLCAHQQHPKPPAHKGGVREPFLGYRSAWYDKQTPTFADALASVRLLVWKHAQNQPEHLPMIFSMSGDTLNVEKIKAVFHSPLLDRMTRLLCYAH